ncbi:uncharacterized protein LOC109721705 isoform X7 [Ananas comosus]|nr:uncharacterized protein LOC109721705 isoform X7 [Ananas comosus]XP_020105045.1 uncharacterized protein LOC109721705 isoform X7 [Ananas comosus]XP_020105046.1 uncharacterized protein LOC109721705 isoform X7 [Ananas comosus]
MSSSMLGNKNEGSKLVLVWTESRQVMTAAVERGWRTFVFGSEPFSKELVQDWSSTALIHPLFVDGAKLLDEQGLNVGMFYGVSSPRELELIRPDDMEVDNLVINFQGEWQVIPAENIVAAFQGFNRTVLAVATTSTEAQVFLEALEQGLDGVVLKVEDTGEILKLKEYFDRRNEVSSRLALTKATITNVEVVGMGDRVCVDLCSVMRPGEGLLVGSFARGLFLVHSECLETNYIASRPFRINAGPVHAYLAVPGGKTCYLSELRAGKEVTVVDQSGLWRTAIVGRVKIESRPLVLVEAKENLGEETYSIFLQNAETVGLVCPSEAEGNNTSMVIPVTSLKVGDEILVRKQGGARHTGIEIREFILEK